MVSTKWNARTHRPWRETQNGAGVHVDVVSDDLAFAIMETGPLLMFSIPDNYPYSAPDLFLICDAGPVAICTVPSSEWSPAMTLWGTAAAVTTEISVQALDSKPPSSWGLRYGRTLLAASTAEAKANSGTRNPRFPFLYRLLDVMWGGPVPVDWLSGWRDLGRALEAVSFIVTPALERHRSAWRSRAAIEACCSPRSSRWISVFRLVTSKWARIPLAES